MNSMNNTNENTCQSCGDPINSPQHEFCESCGTEMEADDVGLFVNFMEDMYQDYLKKNPLTDTSA